MKLSIILFFTACLQVSAAGNAQTISISVKDAALESVIKNIRKQSGYDFVYTREAMRKAKPISLDVKNASLKEALDKCFMNQPLTYSIIENVVVVKGKELVVAAPVKQEIQLADIDVRGKVVDENGLPVLASVTVKGTTNATSTNERGEFELKGVSENATLVFTGVGIEDHEVRVSGRTNILVTLKTKMTTVEEVVISTGYQNLKKSQLTGAYSTIGASQYMQSVPVSGNIVENMEGKIPGLVLNLNQSRSGFMQPDNTSPFTIRGVSTFQAIKKPLIVLNGYPTEIDIESINPYDIESITVLKDAASAAIYGVRASNGVIVINTKNGKSGKPQFHFNTAITYKPKVNFDKLDLIKGRGFVDFEAANSLNDIEVNYMSKEMYEMFNGTYSPVFSIADDLYNGLITGDEANKLYNDLAAYDNTEDYKKLFLQNPLLQTYNLNVSGGGNMANYFFGVSHVNNQGQDKGNGFDKTNINFKGNFDITKGITLDVQTIYSNMNRTRVPIPDYMQMKPYERFKDANGNPNAAIFAPFNEDFFGFGQYYGQINSAVNESNMAMGLYDEFYYPLQEVKENKITDKIDVYRVQANLKAKITKGLYFEMGGVVERELSDNLNYASENAYQTRIMLNYFAKMDPVTGNPIFAIPQGGIKKNQSRSTNSYTLRAQLTFNKLVNYKHDLSFLAGAEQRKITTESSLNTVFGYSPNSLTIKPADLNLLGNYNYFPDYYDVIVSGLSFPIDQTSFNQYFRESNTDNRFLSYYGNAAYTYNSKYTLTGSLRIDQSNLFGSDPKFRYTPLWSLGAAWNIVNEDFMLQTKLFNELKLRVAGGYNGNIIKGSGPFNILSSSVNTTLQNPLTGYYITAPRNNELRWEKTFNLNTGVDFMILDGALAGSVDYYIKKSIDVFSSVASDPTLGFNNLLTNNASIMNKGVDLSLSSLNMKRGKFSWRSQLTASLNKSEVLKLRNKYAGFFNFARAGGTENIEGHPLNSVLALVYAGLNDAGQPMVKNEKGENVVVSFSPSVDIPFSALKFAGVNDPTHVFGLNNQFSLGKFDLSALIMFYGGHVGLVQPPNIFDDRPENGVLNFWKKLGDEATTNIPGFGGEYGSPEYFDNRYGYQNGLQFVRKLDYLALRDVTLTYNLVSAWTQRAGFNNSKIIMQVQNAAKYVFSGNDIDPESFDFISGKRRFPIVPAFTISFATNF